jgi:misacylated tRNA(Ala) deacylase
LSDAGIARKATVVSTVRVYWEDDHCVETEARVIAVEDDAIAFDRTCFYPGGGGQPSDSGTIALAGGQMLEVASARVADDQVVWHVVQGPLSSSLLGQSAKLSVNRERRLALARHHTVLHVLNTIALRDYGAWITGVQIGMEYSRIDFKWEGFSPAICGELEGKVNSVLRGNHALKSYYIPEEEFQKREDLLRTLEVKPPVIGGRVRVVEIVGFDAQACGGTHAGNTRELGRFSIFRTENKGRINKRLYVRLESDAPQQPD